MKAEYLKDIELTFERDGLVVELDICDALTRMTVDVKVSERLTDGRLDHKAWVMTEFDDLYNKIRFVDLYSYQKQVGYSSLAVSILVELYKSIMEPTLLSATKCYGNLSSIGDENPEIQHLKRVKFWSDLGFSVSQGGHEDNPRMVCLLQNLSISPNAKDVSQEFYKISNYV
ncbi:hypothetical protein [Vibrio taketomensis]|uniref:hypothetical protein n=1 Tax=Vibrio taketomensis TaxID=2572923 RepID=UPI00138A57EF|nr:hypothetical protein [Vibrio taketomensis]